MAFPYEFFVGLRYLKAKRRQKSISLNTLISIGGVMVGVAALIATLAVMTGFKEDLRDKILGTNSHIVITDRTREEIPEYPRLVDEAKKVPQVVAATPFIFRQVLLSSDTNVFGVVLRGINPETEAEVTEIGKNIVEGRLDYLTNPPESSLPEEGIEETEGEPAKVLPGIIIGRELAGRLGAFLGDRINIVSPVGKEGTSIGKSLTGPMGFTPKIRKFRVVGIFDSGMYEYDSSLAYISIKEAQNFFNLSDVVTGIEVKVDDIFIADRVAQQIETHLGFPYQARDWMKLNRNLFSALQLEKMMMFIILVLIILVASFNIVSTLTMTVVEKSREIAILKAMGATRDSIMRIFMLEGVIIGLVGVILGTPLGLVVCWLLQKFYTLPADIYYISHLPVKINALDVVMVSLAAVLIGFFATLYPSWQAAKLDPAEALRYE
ncbi:MAG: lipoprotein-releasing ABC transporter permease subunit [Candidatus Manganitrophus sp.]|nr:lipoprotein-releasing ABC transporter permease subunit [Candidatus Manganitrophus sp.]WDT71110.1 MAG: lipoprotein-releasing ABC transporter permease subunit [Candidatus Manganitrophus sp.]WDT76640.1 MAG: lipoprotein-releasing ABC transporter permease subunit [Candidatus Manganitrophus sp.]WDT81599.1 MAG: lipoprotein-releasing ABC transporter permease subunit [Candidatus Manganitrophus sp.]